MTTTAQADEADRALKARHRAMWALGDYPALADELIPDLGAVLTSACRVRPGATVLDVAAGRATPRSRPPFATSTPLWYYILAEAKLAANGLHLGPVGGRIVAETLIGLLSADPASYLSADPASYLSALPAFTPFLGTDLKLGPSSNSNITGTRTNTRAHFLYYAGVVTPGTYR